MDSKKLYSALYALTATGIKAIEYPSLVGVYFDNRSIVSSNAYAIVVAKTDYPPVWEGKILDKDGKEITVKPLNYKSALAFGPMRAPRYSKVADFDELKRALDLMPQSPDIDGERIGIEIEGSVFYPALMLKTLAVFEAIGQVPEIFVDLQAKGADSRCILLSENGSIGVVMGLNFPEGDHPDKITIKDAVLCGDLL